MLDYHTTKAGKIEVALNNKYAPLNSSEDLDILLEAIGDSSIVMLGEASHGTHEYYTWRSKISKRLIEEKGFDFIAVEGDWPDCYEINRYVKGYLDEKDAVDVLRKFNRWPTWMWSNWEIAELMDWLRANNKDKPKNQKVGFYGLDVYSLWDSLSSILNYLKENDRQGYETAQKAWQCFEPYQGDEGYAYAKATQLVPHTCQKEVIEMLLEIREKTPTYNSDPEAGFNTEQNAVVAVNAEKYYRAMIRGGADSWNVRDRHMAETLNRLKEYHGNNSKAIIWEHNTHIGDARYTDMKNSGMVNIGQLAREKYGEEEVFLVGFGSYQGSVIAGNNWAAEMENMFVPEAREDSWEAVCHALSQENKLFLSENIRDIKALQQSIGHRAIGVVYHPERERFGNYVPTIIPYRYDAFLHIDHSQALHPLDAEQENDLMPETYPWGL